MSDSGGLTRPNFRNAKMLLCCAGALLVGLVALRVSFLIQCTEVRTSATYRGITFHGNDGLLRWASSPRDQSLAEDELFLQFPGHQAISIHDLSEEYLQKNYSMKEATAPGIAYYDEPFFSRHLDGKSAEYWGIRGLF
jgi:hypothetical protein